MPTIVDVTGVGKIEFPDTMSEDDITQVLLKKPWEQTRTATAIQPPGIPDVIKPPISARDEALQSMSGAMSPTPLFRTGQMGPRLENITTLARAIPADVAAGASLLKRPEGQPPPLWPSLPAIKQNLPAAAEASGNIPAALRGETELPIDTQIAEAAQESPGSALTARISQDLAGTAPLLAIGMLPATAARLITAGFTVDMVRHAPELFNQYAEEINKPKEEQRPDVLAKLQSGILQTFLFAPAAGAHSFGKAAPELWRDAKTAFDNAERLTPEAPSQYDETINRGLENASQVTSAEGLPQPEVRPSMGEGTPLRQQGEATRTQEPIPERGETPSGAGEIQVAKEVETAKKKPEQQRLNPVDAHEFSQGLRNKTVSELRQLRDDHESDPMSKSDHVIEIINQVIAEKSKSLSISVKSEQSQPSAQSGSTEASGEIVGMGGAVPSEFDPQARKFTTKNTVEQINKERKERGVPPLEEHEVFSNKQAVAEAERRMDDDFHAADKIVDRLREKPETTLDPPERAIMAIHRAQLSNAYYRALKNWRDHFEGNDFERAAVEAENADMFSKQLTELDSLVGEGGSGTAAGRSLQAIKIGIREDFSLDMMTLKKMKAKGGALTREEQFDLLKQHERISELEKQLEEAEASHKQASAEADTREATTEAVKAGRKRQASDKAKGTTRDLEAEQKALVDHLKETFIEEGSVAGEATSVRKLMELLVEREGITERLPMETRVHEILRDLVDPTITREAAMDLMSGYGKSRLPSPDFAKRTVRDINAQIIQVRKLLDYFKGEHPKLTGQLRDAPSDIQRMWNRMVNEAKKAFKLEATPDNAKSVKSALDAIKTRLRNRLKDLKQEVATRQKIVRGKTAAPYDEETVRLRKEIEEVKKAHDEIFGGELTDAERLTLAEKSADRQITELERQLSSGEIFPNSKVPFAGESPKLTAAKAKIEELKQQRQFARESAQPKMEPNEKFLLNYLLRLRQRAAEIQERTAKGDFEKKVKPVRETSPDILEAKANIEKVKAEYNKGLHEYEMARRTTGRKIWDGIKKTRGAFVNIASSYDFSAPRQALISILGNTTRLITHPKQGLSLLARPTVDMFKAWASDRQANIIEQRIKSRPNAISGADKAAGIEYTDLNTTKFTKHEENAHSVLDEWAALPLRTGNAAKSAVTALPKLASRGIRMSNRAFIAFLNQTRAGLFDELVRTQFNDRPPTDAELKLIGNWVNVATGRGKLKPTTSSVASEVIWAPKLLASRVQALTGQPLWTGKWAESGRARKIVAQEYARAIIGGYLLWNVSRMFDDKDEKNPTAADFGKIKRGNTRIDPWGGLQQVTTLAARTATGETKTMKGDVRDIGAARKYGQRGVWHTWADFGRSKLRPDVGALVDIAARSDFTGKPTSTSQVAESLLVPLPMRDIVSIMKDHGFTEGMIIEALGQFGAGVSQFEEKERQR